MSDPIEAHLAAVRRDRITKGCHHSRPKPTLCADCRDVLALERTS